MNIVRLSEEERAFMESVRDDCNSGIVLPNNTWQRIVETANRCSLPSRLFEGKDGATIKVHNHPENGNPTPGILLKINVGCIPRGPTSKDWKEKSKSSKDISQKLRRTSKSWSSMDSLLTQTANERISNEC